MTEMTSRSPSISTEEQYAVQYDRLDDEPLSVAVADAVATFCNVDVTELDPLHYAINADALERLFEPRADGLRSGGSVTFEYNDCLVTVDSNGEIRVADA
ncbi:HalOD1 output domain-containing protein [Halosolutus amylolyticus]|uniref:HalOD1 output domain-containing protein n=1 Tax=Halosolutus amylolyticus TaxID=2932267 RepID=A0ABD5PNL1_9EURY|nr:HalOD1 output domain-containing protein [Halosolutus amylolyticus]